MSITIPKIEYYPYTNPNYDRNAGYDYDIYDDSYYNVEKVIDFLCEISKFQCEMRNLLTQLNFKRNDYGTYTPMLVISVCCERIDELLKTEKTKMSRLSNYPDELEQFLDIMFLSMADENLIFSKETCLDIYNRISGFAQYKYFCSVARKWRNIITSFNSLKRPYELRRCVYSEFIFLRNKLELHNQIKRNESKDGIPSDKTNLIVEGTIIELKEILKNQIVIDNSKLFTVDSVIDFIKDEDRITETLRYISDNFLFSRVAALYLFFSLKFDYDPCDPACFKTRLKNNKSVFQNGNAIEVFKLFFRIEGICSCKELGFGDYYLLYPRVALQKLDAPQRLMDTLESYIYNLYLKDSNNIDLKNDVFEQARKEGIDRNSVCDLLDVVDALTTIFMGQGAKKGIERQWPKFYQQSIKSLESYYLKNKYSIDQNFVEQLLNTYGVKYECLNEDFFWFITGYTPCDFPYMLFENLHFGRDQFSLYAAIYKISNEFLFSIPDVWKIKPDIDFFYPSGLRSDICKVRENFEKNFKRETAVSLFSYLECYDEEDCFVGDISELRSKAKTIWLEMKGGRKNMEYMSFKKYEDIMTETLTSECILRTINVFRDTVFHTFRNLDNTMFPI